MATTADIQYHYDVHNDFYALFLDTEYRAYSCAVWESTQSLEAAQLAKIERLCNFAGVARGSFVLDIGCGWGGLMQHAVQILGARAARGLTLSVDQLEHVSAQGDPRITASLTSWANLPLAEPHFDAVVSVGAFEHFASREDRLQGRQREIYRQFFHTCRRVSTDVAKLGLQTIVTVRAPKTLQEARDARYLLDKVFPGSALPSISDVQASAADIYEMATVKRIGLDYARTLACWRERLEEQHKFAEQRFGIEVVSHYLHYFAAAERSFAAGVTDLLQVAFVPVGGSR
jgi:cyclopropane-fatty-acyl-phospholipid synthase